MKTPTLALTRQLNRLNGTTLSTWLTLRGAVQAHLLAGHHQGVHVHSQHLPLFAGVRAGEVHTSRQRASLHSARPSNALTKLGVMGLLGTWEKRQKAWLMGHPVSHQAI